MSGDTYSTRLRGLALLGTAVLSGLSLWCSASAIGPRLRPTWGMPPAQTGWLSTIVQLGFVCGTAIVAVLSIADSIPAAALFSVSALLGSLANAGILAVPG